MSNEDIKINENQSLPFLCFCATRLTAVAALQAYMTLLCLKSRNSGETRSAKAKKRKTLVFIDFNIYIYIYI